MANLYNPEQPQGGTEIQDQSVQMSPMEQALAPYMSEVGSISAEVDALGRQKEENNKEIAQLQENLRTAKEQGLSLFGSLVEKQKPVYDDKKETRMRNAAIIQSLGDVLSAAARGYFAYNKNGAGVVPTTVQSNAFDGVRKISEMQAKYLNDKKAWEDLEFKWRQAQNAADIESAEALLSNAKSVQQRIDDEIKRLRARGVKITDKVRDTVSSMIIGEYEKDLDDRREIAQLQEKKRLGLTGGGGGSKKSKDEYKTDERDLRMVYEWVYGLGEDADGNMQTWDGLTNVERERIIRKAGNDPAIAIGMILLDEGLGNVEVQKALESIAEMKASGRYDIAPAKNIYEKILSDYIASGMPLSTYIDNLRSEEYILNNHPLTYEIGSGMRQVR